MLLDGLRVVEKEVDFIGMVILDIFVLLFVESIELLFNFFFVLLLLLYVRCNEFWLFVLDLRFIYRYLLFEFFVSLFII